MKLVRGKEGYRKVGDKYLLAKKCTKCGRWLVASTVNFHREKKGKYGLTASCKKCRNKKGKQWREDSPEYYKQYCETNKEKIAEYKKQYYEDNKERIAERDKRYREANKERIAERQKQWHEANKEKIAERNKQYYKDNKEKIAEKHKQYYKNNKERIAEYHKQWNKQYYQTPQGQVVAFNRQQRRRIKEEQLGSGITKDQWLEMMSFFDWKCAYSDEYIGGKQNYQRTIDHIVPLNSGGDNMIWNMIPMTRSLNSSKQDKDMVEWYREQECYDPKRLQKIYKWQEYAYNKWGKDTEYFNTNDIQITLL